MARSRPLVAVVTDAIFPYHRGGKEIRYHEITRRLTEHVDVHVHTMKWWRGPRVKHENGVTFHAISPRLSLYTTERRSILQALVFAGACFGLLFKRFDVIEADHMPYIHLFPLRLVAAVRRKRLVVTWHEVWGPDYWREYLGPAGRVGWWFEHAAMRLPHAIIAASSETAERLRHSLPHRSSVTVAPGGVDLEAIRGVQPAAQRHDLVVVGRLLSHKRVDLLLDAVALLAREGRSVTCRIIGDGPERKALRAQAADLRIDHLVEFCHNVATQQELYALLKAARAFVFPSEREGFGVAVLEALACGLPVVTTSAPDNLSQLLVRRAERSIVCDPSAPALADAIGAILDRLDDDFDGDEAPWLAEFDWRSVTERVAGAVLA